MYFFPHVFVLFFFKLKFYSFWYSTLVQRQRQSFHIFKVWTLVSIVLPATCSAAPLPYPPPPPFRFLISFPFTEPPILSSKQVFNYWYPFLFAGDNIYLVGGISTQLGRDLGDVECFDPRENRVFTPAEIPHRVHWITCATSIHWNFFVEDLNCSTKCSENKELFCKKYVLLILK